MENSTMENINDTKLIDKIEHEIFKLPLFEEQLPHIFVQNALFENRFRFSTSYEKLNKDFGIKIQINRNLDCLKNTIKYLIFDKNLKGPKYTFKNKFKAFNSNFYYQHINRVKVNESSSIMIDKLRFKFGEEDTVIFLITKTYGLKGEDSSQGLFFASNKFFSIELFISDLESKGY